MGAEPAATPTVEFLWWNGCPSWDSALSELREEMEAAGLNPAAVRLIEVERDADAEALGFPGSPTIRVDGADVQDPGAAPRGLTCRVYRLRDGRISALPDRADVREALIAATAGQSAGVSDG